MLSFGERLKMARERTGMTQAQAAKAVLISDKSLSRYENNASSPDPGTILRLIRLYDVSADYIIGLSHTMGHAAGKTSGVPSDNGKTEDYFDAHQMLDELSGEYRKKAEEYIKMLTMLG